MALHHPSDRLSSTPADARPTPVAIVGIGLRLPGGVADPRALVRFLSAQGDGVREVPADRYDLGLHYDPQDTDDKVYVARAGFIDQDIFTFDPAPFGMSPREADHLDPQQRLLLETTFEAFEDAGMSLQALRGSNTAVYVGGFMLDALGLALDGDNRKLVTQHTATGAPMTVLANRLSHTFDLRGPSMTVDTACSSSLVATHLACEALRAGTSDVAIAGGVNVILTTNGTLIMCKGKFLAADGRSKAFEADADGYGRGEGAGVVVLKRLGDALRDGDRVYAVIRASGINQDGRTDGMPLPNGDAQAELSASVLARSGLQAADVGYAEAHGTGTRAGDPLEVRALAATYGRQRRSPLFIGSIKSNIGHLEAGAGVVGLIKAALSIEQSTLLPQRALRSPNPEIPFEALGVEVVQAPRAWPDPQRRVAAVNSFGYGGTNAHAVLSDVGSAAADFGLDPVASESKPVGETPLLLSAASEAALRDRAHQLACRLEDGDLPLPDLAATLAQRRSALTHRLALWPRSAPQAVADLRAWGAGEAVDEAVEGRATGSRKTLWVFTGMGPQWWGMAQGLYEADDVFREVLLEADVHFARVAGWSLVEQMLAPESSSRMASNAIAQPANLFVQAGLLASMRARGMRAEGYLGHSVGEVAAAHAAGVFDLRQAVEVAYHRSQLQQRVAGRGTMLAAAISAEHARTLIGDRPLEIAAYNAPASVAIAGAEDHLRSIAEALDAAGTFARIMGVEVAYHSHHMDPLRDGFFETLGGVHPCAPASPLYSTLYGARIDPAAGAVHDAAYWWGNARQPVRLQQALEAAFDDGYDLLVEVGPHPVLRAAIRENAKARGVDVATTHTLHRREAGPQAMRRVLAECWTHGGRVEPPTGTPRADLDLPRYPFQREHHWIEADSSREKRLGRPGAHPLLQRRLPEVGAHAWSFDATSWAHRWVRGHRVDGQIVFPGAGYIEAMVAAAREAFGDAVADDTVLESLTLSQPLILAGGRRVDAIVVVTTSPSGASVEVRTVTDGSHTVHARARLHPRPRFEPLAAVDLDTMPHARAVDVEALYGGFSARGLDYDGPFRGIESVSLAGDEVCATLRVPEDAREGYRVHPAVLDTAFQALLAPRVLREGDDAGPVVPVGAARIRVLGPCTEAVVFMRGRAVSEPGGVIRASLVLHDAAGRVLLDLRDLECRPVRPAAKTPSAAERRWFHGESFVPVQLERPAITGQHWAVVGPASTLADTLSDALRKDVTVHRIQTAADLGAQRLDHVVVIPGGDVHLLLRAAGRLAGLREARLTVVTEGAYAAIDGAPIDPMASACAGLSRVVMTEHSALRARVVDVPRASVSAATLVTALASTEEEELCVGPEGIVARRVERNDGIHAARLESCGTYVPGQSTVQVELHPAQPGRLDALAFRPLPADRPAALAADEVEIAVETTSINFKDVMKAMGMLSSTALQSTYLGDGLGMEAVGTVTAIGEAVRHVHEGERVYIWKGGCIATRVRTRAPFVVPLRADADPIEAACRFVFITAQYALRHVGRLAAGERVLIHSAAGGVGLAAVQVAQAVGAEVFATAGTPDKRATLRALGIAHVYDSRSLDFADAIARDTDGQGVDVVLNALAGPAQRKSLELLRDGGRFLELGKQDIAAGGDLPLLAFNRALTFAAIDLDRISSSHETLVADVAREVWAAFADGTFTPLPTETFTADDAVSAFRRLASGDVVGKVAIDFRGRTLTTRPGLTDAAPIRPGATYLVTGGLGGFGLRTARWLVSQGATHIALASRRGEAQGSDAARLRALIEAGDDLEVQCIALDVCAKADVMRVVAALDRPEAPLRGVFHSAMVLDDGALADLDPHTLDRVLAPKIRGALHLHEATRARALDHFVLYSSVSALVGNPGQGAYAAANAFLDGLAQHRVRDLGLPGLSVAWGALGESGVVARDPSVQRHLESMGLRLLSPSRALVALGHAMRGAFPTVGVIDIDWSRWRRATAPTPWARLSRLDDDDAGAAQGTRGLAAQLAAMPEEDRSAHVLGLVGQAVGEVLRIAADEVDVERPLKDYGVDSLMAVELQVALEQGLSVEFSTMELLAGKNARTLAARALEQLQRAPVAAATEAQPAVASLDPQALRARFLAEICVQPPYFALESMRADAGWIHAEATPTPPADVEAGPVSVAEAARHLAILGSCAVRAEDAASGRIYYPVRQAELEFVSTLPAAPLQRLVMRARSLDQDRRTNAARAVTEILGDDGEAVLRFIVTYHVIPEAEFTTLFAAHQRETFESSGDDPYRGHAPLPEATRTPAGWSVELGEVDPRGCLGHFVGYPAYPVSIMARDAVALVGRALRHERGDVRIRVEGGGAGTRRFIFAGQRATMHARPVEGGWRVEIHADDEGPAAWFDMKVSEVD